MPKEKDNLKISCEFQDRFTDLVAESGLKKPELARLIGIGNDILIRAMSVGMIPSTSSLIKVADFFDVSIDFLIGLSDNENFVKSEEPLNFQKRIEELKEKYRKTEFEIAKTLGFQRSLFTKWKNKNYIPSLEIIILLIQFFKVSIDYLLGRTDYQNS